jgi:hypothetical protein
MSPMDTPGTAFAQALAAKDFDRVRALLAGDVDFRGMTPRRTWEANEPEAVVTEVLRHWFDDDDTIEALEHLEHDAFADRERVGYRFRVRNPSGLHLVEQQAYLASADGRITWMRVLCSGFRPVAEPVAAA